jgi:hypothetical protein
MAFKRWVHKLQTNKRYTHNLIITLVVILSILIVAIFVYRSQPTDIDRLSNTYLDTVQDASLIRKNVSSSFEDVYAIEDYTIYGESLLFYQEPYTENSTSDLLGKNVVLRNVETGQELLYTFDSAIDSGVNLGELDDGLYEVYVYDHYMRKRIYSASQMYTDDFYTIRRDGKVKCVNLVADANYLKDFKVSMDENYLFITVISQIPKVKVVDVVIDPSGQVYNESAGTVDAGMGSSLIDEASASYELACMIKEELEASGLRVALTRSDEASDTPSYYGSDSRVAVGYNSSAKVFLNLSMLYEENENYLRPYFMVSSLTKSSLGNALAYEMNADGIELSNPVTEELLEKGVVYDGLSQQEDGTYTKLSLYPQLRETGGKATLTGTSDISTGNTAFQSANGMAAVMFRYCNLAMDDSVEYYLENKEEIARSIAQALLNYYSIGVEISETSD